MGKQFRAQLVLDTKGMVDGLDQAKEKAKESGEGISRAFARFTSAAVAVRMGFEVASAAVVAHSAKTKLAEAQISGSASRIMEAQLGVRDAWMQVVSAVPLIGPAIRRGMEAFGDTAEIEKAIASIREVEAATKRAAITAEDWGRKAAIAMAEATGQPKEEVARLRLADTLTPFKRTIDEQRTLVSKTQRDLGDALTRLAKQEAQFDSVWGGMAAGLPSIQGRAAATEPFRLVLASSEKEYRTALRELRNMETSEATMRTAGATAIEKTAAAERAEIFKQEAAEKESGERALFDTFRRLDEERNRESARATQDRLREETDAVRASLRARESDMESSFARIEALKAEKTAGRDDLGSRLFGLSLEGSDEKARMGLYRNRVVELGKAAQAALAGGDFERAKAKASEAMDAVSGTGLDKGQKEKLIRRAAGFREKVIEQELADQQKAAASAAVAIQDLDQKLAALQDQSKITVEMQEAAGNLDVFAALQAKLDALQDKTITVAVNAVESHAAGGWAGWGSPPGADTVRAWLSPGEFVVNAASAAANPNLLEVLNAHRGAVSPGLAAGAASGASARGYAAGGPVVNDHRAYSTDRSEHFHLHSPMADDRSIRWLMGRMNKIQSRGRGPGLGGKA